MQKLLRTLDPVLRFVNWVRGLVCGVSGEVTTVAGLVIVMSAMIAGVLISRHEIGVIVAAFGACLGTLAIAIGLDLSRQSGAGKADEAETKRLRSEAECREQANAVLIERITHLQRQRINVDSFVPQLRLMLLKVKTQYKDMRRVRFSKNGSALPMDDQTNPNNGDPKQPAAKRMLEVGQWEVLAFMERDFAANLGVDLTRLRLSEAADVITVTGLQPNYQGCEQMEQPRWTIKEVREQQRTASAPFAGELIVMLDDPRKDKVMSEMERVFASRLNAGLDFKYLDEPICAMGETFLRVILAPLGKRLEFLRTEADPAGRGLIEFMQAHNGSLDKECERLRGVLLTERLHPLQPSS